MWLEYTYTQLLENNEIKFQAISDIIRENGDVFSQIRMKASSWGENSDFTVWNSPEHAWLWPYIYASSNDFERVLQKLIESNRHFSNWDERILKQAARELLLLEGSDWPFLMYTEQAKMYANQRFHHHHQRFNKLLWAAQNLDDFSRINDTELRQMEDVDNPWPEIDFWDFQRKK